MLKKTIRLFDLFGFEVKIDLSWFILGFLITWTLAKGFFPNMYNKLFNSNFGGCWCSRIVFINSIS
jgi:hypothetical protein